MGVTVRQKLKGKGKPWWVFVNHDNRRTSKMVGTKDAANAVAKKIEAQRINTITRGDIKTFLLEKLNEGCARSTVIHTRNCLSGVFNMAVGDEVLQGKVTVLAYPETLIGGGRNHGHIESNR